MRKRIRQGGAVMLALALAWQTGLVSHVTAATAVETGRECSVTVELDGSSEELKSLSIPVKLYRVAEVSESGNYTMLPGYESLKLSEVDSDTSAQEWEEKAKTASDLVKEQTPEADAELTITGGTGTEDGLPTGMYLVEAEEVQSPEYTYTFSPFLLSLPNNYYGSGGSDDWVYDVTTGLKPDQEERLGDLEIEKTLTSYNATVGGATFVFSVEAVKEDEVVYSDVVSVAFDRAGTRQILVEDIPAGSEVTVTEVYSGSSYENTGAASQTVEILADGTAGSPVQVSFTNTYDHGLNGGSGVVNHFDYTEEEGAREAGQSGSGTWEWNQLRDNTAAEE